MHMPVLELLYLEAIFSILVSEWLSCMHAQCCKHVSALGKIQYGRHLVAVAYACPCTMLHVLSFNRFKKVQFTPA